MNKLLAARAFLAPKRAEPVSLSLAANTSSANEISAKASVKPAPLTAAQLHERYLENVFQYAARRVARRSEAEDITAEVFAAAFADLPRFKGDLPLAWLLGIARCKVADSLRRSARRRETLASELAAESAAADALMEQAGSAPQTPEQIVQRQEAHKHIRALVDALPADQREALLLQYVEELSIAEIGVVMGRSAKAVNSLLQRARVNVYKTGSGYFLSEYTSDFSPAAE